MQKLSEIISKNVYCLGSGNLLGYVLNAVFDEKLSKIKSFIVVDDESEIEGEIDAKNMHLAGDNFFVDNQSCLQYGEVFSSNPLGKSVFTQHGVDCGKIKEVLLEKYNVVAFVTQNITFSPKQIAVCGNHAVILGKSKKNKPSNQKFLSDQPQQLVSIASAPQVKTAVATPHRISSQTNSLLGKMATRDIFGLNNEIIIKKFEIITQKKLNTAKKHNKLNILFYNCK